jgi:hypothetical protein
MSIYSSFITSSDLEQGIKTEFLGQITSGNLNMVADAVADAISLMKDYLSQRFDGDSIFAPVGEYNESFTYRPANEKSYIDDRGHIQVYTPTHELANGMVTNRCWFNDQLFRCTQESVGQSPDEDESEFWLPDDYRDAKIRRMVVDITLFLLHRRINPRKIPDLRLDLYNQAKEWMTLVKDREITPTIANYFVPADSVDYPRFGFNKKQNHYF